MNKSIEEIRDQLASHLEKTEMLHEAMGYTIPRAFKDGFDAGYAEMEKRAQTLVEALEFYADVESWVHEGEQVYGIIIREDHGKGDFDFNENTDDDRVGGLRAREALEKWRAK